eukprot:SAG31_NODE_1344_length_8699_cov_15.971512_6_plen_431_part_00
MQHGACPAAAARGSSPDLGRPAAAASRSSQTTCTGSSLTDGSSCVLGRNTCAAGRLGRAREALHCSAAITAAPAAAAPGGLLAAGGLLILAAITAAASRPPVITARRRRLQLPGAWGMPDAAQTIAEEWATQDFGAGHGSFFRRRLELGGTAAAGALGRYVEGGGNTPYVFGDWEADPADPTLMQWRAFHTVPGPYRLGSESLQRSEGAPEGTVVQRRMQGSTVYPLTKRDWWTYVPAQYDAATPAPVLFFQDGAGYVDPDGQVRATVVLDNLIASGEIPPTVAVFLNPGERFLADGSVHPEGPGGQRSFEYDSITGQYADFLLADVLPALAEAGIVVSANPECRGLVGISSSGVCAFAACFNRPDAFRKAICHVGSFTNIRGAHNLQYLVRTTPRKPIRVLLQSGTHDFDNSHGRCEPRLRLVHKTASP